MATIFYTSGSAARPKGAVSTHRAHAAMAVDFGGNFDLSPKDRSLLCSPLFHVGGWCTTAMPALAAGCSIVMPGRFSASRFWDDVERWQPTIFTTGLAFLEMVAARGGEPPARLPFRHVVSNLRADTWELAKNRLGLPLGTYYGLTENTGRGTIVLGLEEYIPGFVGYPYTDGDRIRIMRDGEEVPTGEHGEIQLRGPSVINGYFRNPPSDPGPIRPGGWLATGDLGFRDDQGGLHYVGRLKNMIKRAGENVSVEEVEILLLEHPDVADASVLPIPDRVREEEIKAVVVKAAGSTLDEQSLHAYCLERTTRFKVPRYIEFVDVIPRTPSGKPDIGSVRREHSGTERSWDAEEPVPAGDRGQQ